MVKAKRQQQKSKKQNNPKKGKNQEKEDLKKFREQLDALGLKIVQVTSDGNCFFRSLADQLEGDEEQHMKYRLMVVDYIMKNREEFEPFIEDDVLFDDYCKSMEEDGTWAGHMELQAASLVTQCNICIHRMMSPRWYIQNFDSDRTQMVHLSYHDGEHYNSLRLKYDEGVGPARVIIIKADANLSSTSSRQTNFRSRASTHGTSVDDAVKKVMSEASCYDTKKVEQVLREFNGDIDVAIQFIMAERAFDECSTKDDNCQKIDFDSCPLDEIDDCGTEMQKGPQSDCLVGPKVECDEILNENCMGKPSEKIIPRNKVCPCGSKKKYKACCGSKAGKPAYVVMSRIVSEQAQWKSEKINDLRQNDIPQGNRSGNGKKGKKHGRRRMETADALPRVACNGQIDMGALCI